MKNLIISVTTLLQFILLIFLSVNYYSTNSKVELLINKLSELTLEQDQNSTIPQPTNHLDSALSLTAKHDSKTASDVMDELKELKYTVLDTEQLAKRLKKMIEEALLTDQTSVSSAYQIANSNIQKPEENQAYLELNEQVSDYITAGTISEQAFISLSHKMFDLHPQQREQLLLRLARELNRQ